MTNRSQTFFVDSILTNLLVRDAVIDGGFLLQSERDALLHIINGGNIDDALGTGSRRLAVADNGGSQPVVLLPGDDSGG